MNKPAPMQWALSAPETSAARALRTGGIVLGGTLFVAVCAHLSLPLYFTPVPLTLQPFAVLVLGLLLGPRMAFGTLTAYLAEGAMGLPVFAPGPAALSGLAHFFGPTGGYLMAYPVAAALIAALWQRSNRSFSWGLLSAVAGDALILATGAVWLALWTHGSTGSVLTQAVLPFLPGEALKIAAAAGLAAAAVRLRRANQN
jgi:biotin transport system substrate-specific component